VTELTRRDLLGRGAAAAGALLLSGTPKARAASGTFDGTIRIATLGLALGAVPSITKRAEQELGLKILPEFAFPDDFNRWVRQQPAAFDIVEGYSWYVTPDWPSGHLQPIEISKVERWREISPLLRLGKLRPGDAGCTYGQGEAAFRRLYLDPARSGRWPSAVGTPHELDRLLVEWIDERTGRPVGPEPRFCTGVPGYLNFDSFGYNARVIHRQPQELSWAELLNRKWAGRVALQNTPFGLQEAGVAARALGLLRIHDLGNPTRREIDALLRLLIALQRRKHFFGLWDSDKQATNWMRSGEVVIGSMWASSFSQFAGLGFPVRQAAPREGYRAWASLFSISSAVTHPAKLRACYDFVNWWHSGFAGSVMLRSSFFNAVAETARRFMRQNEYAYWVDGRQADRDYLGPFGNRVVRRGQRRDGGPFSRHACGIACWNSHAWESAGNRQRLADFASMF
jgi:putative spermidine/putrescine transport system substrate-binding protein